MSIEIWSFTSKALADKADVCYIMTIPTAVELRKIELYLRQHIIKGRILCINLYKNRTTKHKSIKIWLDVDFPTMRVHDLFVTDDNYELYTDLTPVAVSIDEDTQKIYHYKDYATMRAAQLNSDNITEQEEQEQRQQETEEYLNDLDDGCDLNALNEEDYAAGYDGSETYYEQ